MLAYVLDAWAGAQAASDPGRPVVVYSPPVAAIAACSVEPKMNAEQAERLADTVSDGEFSKLWQAVLAANLRVGDGTPKSVLATTILRTNGASLTSAAGLASPEASS